MESLERIHAIEAYDGKKLGEPMAVAIRVWAKLIQNGIAFSTTLRGWAPARERLMLSVGDVSKLETALENVIKVSEGSAKIIGPLIHAFAYPSFLLLLTFAIIVMVGVYMVPPLASAVPNPETFRWQGSAKSLYDLSQFTQHYWFVFPIGFITAVFFIFRSFPNWSGKLRVLADRIPPWSMYRIFSGVGWLLALAGMVRAGTPISQTLISLRSDATPYLRERIDATLIHVNNGDNLGTALYKSRYEFPDRELIGDLRIYSDLDRFDDALDSLANEWLDQSIQKIQDQAAILNMLAILLVALTIAWVVFGTFEMQDQVVSKF